MKLRTAADSAPPLRISPAPCTTSNAPRSLSPSLDPEPGWAVVVLLGAVVVLLIAVGAVEFIGAAGAAAAAVGAVCDMTIVGVSKVMGRIHLVRSTLLNKGRGRV